MTPLRLFVAEDSSLIRQRLRAMLGTVEGVEWVGEADSPDEALAGIATSHADVAIVDLGLRNGNGLTILQAMRGTPTVTIVLSNLANAPVRRQCLAAGAACVLDKTSEFVRLPETLRTLHARRADVSPTPSTPLP